MTGPDGSKIVTGLSVARADQVVVSEGDRRTTAETLDRSPFRLEQRYRVRFDEATPDESMRTSVYLRYAQDCAWAHSEALGFGRQWYADRGIFWLVRAVQLDVLRPLRTYSVATVSTEVTGWRHASARRLSEVHDDAGALVARAEIDWVLTNERGMPTRVPREFHGLFGSEPVGFEIHRARLPEPPPGALAVPTVVRRQDLDPMAHVNNGAYVDYLEEALEAAGRAAAMRTTPRRYVLEYVAAAGPGDRLVGVTWAAGDDLAYRLRRDDGEELFRAIVSS